MGKNKALFSSPHFHVFSYASCIDLTQLGKIRVCFVVIVTLAGTVSFFWGTSSSLPGLFVSSVFLQWRGP